MNGTELTVKGLHRRFRIITTVLLVVTSSVIITLIESNYGNKYSSRGYHTTHERYDQSFVPTSAQQAATLAATNSYRTEIVHASQSFVTTTSKLVIDIRSGHLSAAKSDESSAQGAFDVLRPALNIGFSSSTPLDALVKNQAPGVSPTGLHAVERALWVGHLGDALRPATQLAANAQILEVLLYRTVLTPSVICDRLRGLLAWTVHNAIDSSQEIYSHQSLLDIKAAAQAIQISVTGIAQIGELVNPFLTHLLSVRTHQLLMAVQSVSSTTDQSITTTTWRTLATRMDALQEVLGEMSGALDRFGTGRPYA